MSQLSKILLLEIKNLLKQKKIQYKHLADHLQMSEAGVKKLMNANDCTISKLEEICDFIGMNLSDILKSLEDKNLKEISFSSKQQQYFEADQLGFLTYWMLVYERREVEEVIRLLKHTNASYLKTIAALDKLNLIVRMPGDIIRLPKPIPVSWAIRSKFIKNLYLKWSQKLVVKAIESHHDPSYEHFLMARNLRLTEQTWLELKQAMIQLEKNFLSRGILEMRIKNAHTKHIRWVMVADQLSWSEDELGLI